MLNDDDRGYVTERLATYLGPLGQPRLALAARLPQECIELIGYHEYPTGYALDAVKVCIDARWRDAPPWLLRLLELLPNEPRTASIKGRIAVAPVTPNPRNARVLVTDSPFVNRQPLRTKLAVFQDTALPPRPVLVINGPEKSGKTYTTEFVTHLVLSGMDYESCQVELPQGSGLAFGPEQLAERILNGMGLSVQKLGPTFLVNTTNSERWAQDLAGRVLSEGAANGRGFWIVLDGFIGKELREDTRRFITAMAAEIVKNSVFRRKYRLILLGFDRSYFTVQPGQIDVEDILPAGTTDVLQCLTEIFTRAGQPMTPEELQPFLTRIMKELPTGEARMREMNQRLVDLMQTLQTALPAGPAAPPAAPEGGGDV